MKTTFFKATKNGKTALFQASSFFNAGFRCNQESDFEFSHKLGIEWESAKNTIRIDRPFPGERFPGETEADAACDWIKRTYPDIQVEECAAMEDYDWDEVYPGMIH